MGPFPCYADEFLSPEWNVEIGEGQGGLHGQHSGNLLKL